MLTKHAHGDHMVHHHRDVSGGAARAAVFGVSDGLVSNAALIIGVAGAAVDGSTVVTAGVAGLIAGAFSMAAGEYVSVKAESELVERELQIERQSIKDNPNQELAELKAIYRQRGLTDSEADILATAIHRNPEVALEVHAREELGVDPESIGDPGTTAITSFIAFSIGAAVPLVPWFFGSGNTTIVISLILAIATAAVVGTALARFTERPALPTALRQVLVASAACAVTYFIGTWIG